MQFPVYTEEQILDMRKEFTPGICDFTVQSAAEGVSKSGNNYIKLEIRAFDNQGTERTIWDFLLATETGAFKVRHFMYSIGLGSAYEAGRDVAPHELAGKHGKADVYLGKDKDRDGNEIKRLKIKDYVYKEQSASNDELDDDIPF